MKLDDFLVEYGKEKLQRLLDKAVRCDKSYFKETTMLINKLKQKKEIEKLSPEKIISKLQRVGNQNSFHPAQEFIHQKMHYGIRLGEDTCVVNSSREVALLSEYANKHNLALVYDHIDDSGFSGMAVANFCQRNYRLDATELYQRAHSYITRFFVFQNPLYAKYLALWIMGTYVFKIFRYFPYVWLQAEKGSGKTLLMEILTPVAFNGSMLLNSTPSVLYRDVSYRSATLFLDESENLKNDKENYVAVISVLNAGFNSSGVVKRSVKSESNFKIKSFGCYSPKIFAGITDINDTLRDRSVRFYLWKKKLGEEVDRYKKTDEIMALQAKLRDDLYVFGLRYGRIIAEKYESEIDECDHLENREKDIWEPIMVLASLLDDLKFDLGLVKDMRDLSLQKKQEKHEANLQDDEFYKLLKVLRDMLNEEKPIQSKQVDMRKYDAKKVLWYFQKTEEFSWINKQHSLTSRLKKLEIKSDQIRLKRSGKFDDSKTRVYVINEAKIKDIFERHQIEFGG